MTNWPLKVSFILALIAQHSFAIDRYVSTTGSDSNPGTLQLPYKTLEKAMSATMPADRIVMRGGTYPVNPGAGLITTVTVVRYQQEAVSFQLLTQTIPLDSSLSFWTDIPGSFVPLPVPAPAPVPPPAPDIKISLTGGNAKNVKITTRKTNTSPDVLITVNPGTVVTVEKK